MYIFLHAKHCPIKRINGGFFEGEGFLLSLIQKYFGHNGPNRLRLSTLALLTFKKRINVSYLIND